MRVQVLLPDLPHTSPTPFCKHTPQALPHLLELLDSAIDGMEVGSDAATQQVELLLPALAAELQGAAARPTAPAALALAATVCEKHAPAAEELRRGGAVAAVARHLLQGILCWDLHWQGRLLPAGPAVLRLLPCIKPDGSCRECNTSVASPSAWPQQPPLAPPPAGPLAAQDAAARLLWLLARGERRCLATAEGQLGCEPLALAQVLSRLLEMAEEARRVGGLRGGSLEAGVRVRGSVDAGMQWEHWRAAGAGSVCHGCACLPAAALSPDAPPVLPPSLPQQARAREEESDGEGNDGQEGDASAGAALASSRDAGNAAAEVCHEEEAAQLLRALAVANPAVQAWLDERQVPVPRPGAQCCIS